jgi:hypothetical protein
MPDETAHDSDARHGGGGPDGPRAPRRRTIKPELLVGVGTLLAGVAAVLALSRIDQLEPRDFEE